jgi:hypothetical protein
MTRSNTARRRRRRAREIEAAERRTGEQDDDADKHKNTTVERRRVATLESVIDEPTQPLTEPQHGRRGDEKGQHRAGHAHPVHQRERQNPAECRKVARWCRRK